MQLRPGGLPEGGRGDDGRLGGEGRWPRGKAKRQGQEATGAGVLVRWVASAKFDQPGRVHIKLGGLM